MRILFLGNNWLGWQTLKWLREQQEEIVGVAMHPEPRVKYGQEILGEVGSMGAAVLDGSRLNESSMLKEVQKRKADIAVSVLFGYILSAEFIESFPQGCINLHPALLPYNRGAYPNVWSIVTRTPAGVTLHYMDHGVDTGDVIAQQEVPVRASDTGATLYRRLEREGLELFKKCWPSIRAGTSSRRPQPVAEGSCHRARDVEKIDEIDLQRSYRAEDLINLIRARTFPPHRGAYFVHKGKKVYLQLELNEEDGKGE